MPNPTAFPSSFPSERSTAPAPWRRVLRALVRLDRHLIALGDPGPAPGAAATRRSSGAGNPPDGPQTDSVSSLLL